MEDRHAIASSVFFTGVSLVIEKEKLRQHFESVGHVVNFIIFGPAPGKDFRYGIAGYMDQQTAEEAIRRLNGTTFGERAMRVTPARSTTLHGPVRAGPGGAGSGPGDPSAFRKRLREPYPSPHAARPPMDVGVARGGGLGGGGGFGPGGGRGRGVGMRAPMARAPVQPQQLHQPNTDRAGRETMQFPHFFTDPIFGREGSLVLDALRGMATEEAYAAVEQLRVLALERPSEAKRLLQNNPALKSAVVMTLQHAGRIPFGSLPREAYQTKKTAEAPSKSTKNPRSPQQRPLQPLPQQRPLPPSPQSSSQIPESSQQREELPQLQLLVPPPQAAHKKETKDAGQPVARIDVSREGVAIGGTEPVETAVCPEVPLPPPSSTMTPEERDEVLELVRNMSEEDVERIERMSAAELEGVPDAEQRKQLELLQLRLRELSRDL